MVIITFKNVGQGDSIIIEWNEGGNSKMGIIDCNIYQKGNPVINHIHEQQINEIEFLILSHPHKDHFSGFLELLEFCNSSSIKIRRFLHTSEITKDYFKSALRSLDAEKDLMNLFSFLRKMRDLGDIEVFSIDDNPDLQIPLGDDYKMEILSPSSLEKDKYIRGSKFPFDEESGENNPNANWLSTVISIYNDDGCVLLTSDVEATTLARIGKKSRYKFASRKMLMSQVPHHGSKGNLNKSFWQIRKRGEITPVIVSVGDNKYNHPSSEVINFFDKTNNYDLYRTDRIKNLSRSASNSSSFLDIVSYKKDSGNNSNGDKKIIFDNKTCIIY